MQSSVASIVSFHCFNDMPPPDLSHFTIQQSLLGLRRTRKDRLHKKEPITPEMLLRIRDKMRHFPRQYRAPSWAACVFGFTTLLRKSNLLPGKRNDRLLKYGDVQRTTTGSSLNVAALKNQRFLASLVTIPVSASGQSHLCPIPAYDTLIFPVDAADTPLFSHVSH